MSSVTQLIPLVTFSLPDYQPHVTVDCGCGVGKWGSIIRVHKSKMRDAYVVGLDLFLPNLNFCKKYGAYDDLILADAQKLPFKSGSVDVVLACEIIEHMEKNDGEQFIVELERVCSGRVIITTPNIHFDNPTEYSDGTVNLYETHKSEWTVKDFKNRGYVVRGIGIRWIRNNLFKDFVAAFDFLLFPSYFFPQIAKFKVAYKDMRTL